MPVKIESLYYFTVLADAGSFTAAAERLYMTQQALSKHIAALEQTLGQTLILRSQGQGQRLTPAGELLRAEAYPLLAQIQALQQPLPNDTLAPELIPLRIGAMLVLDAEIAALLQAWVAREPRLTPLLTLPVGGPAVIEGQLLAGQLDLGLLLQPPVSAELAWAPLTPIPYVIVGAPGMSGSWEQQRYLAYLGSAQSQDALLNVWPENTWPREVVAKADVAMALEMARYGGLCLHIPHHFVDFDLLQKVCEPPFAAAYSPCLVWSQTRPLLPLVADIRDAILAGQGKTA